MSTLPRHRAWDRIALALFLASSVGAAAVQPQPQASRAPQAAKERRDRDPKPDQQAAAALAEQDGVKVEWDLKTGAPDVVKSRDLKQRGAFSGGKGLAAAGNGRYEEDAVAVMDNLSKIYRIRDASKEFQPRRRDPDALGFQHVRLNQLYAGLRVVGADLVVHFDAQDRAYQVNGRYVPDIQLKSVQPRIAAADAAYAAQSDLVERGMPKGEVVVGPDLVVYALEGSPALAYELVVWWKTDGAPGRWRYWVDALSGQILHALDEIAHIDPPAVGGSSGVITGNILAGEGGGTNSITGWYGSDSYYYLWSTGRVWFVYNTDTAQYCRKPTATWGTTVAERTQMSAARNFDLIQQYFRDVHGRNSFNNAAAYACVNVHEGNNYVNAYWDGEDFHFGDGDGSSANSLAVLDVSGHEFTHAVTEYTANLIYQNEPGALNEAFSDIFGVLVEFHWQPDGRSQYPNCTDGQSDWLCGEDAWLSARALRDLRNPANTATIGSGNEKPSRYKGTYWYYGTGDNGGVHYNCTVQAHFFYLLAEGGNGTNDGIPYDLTGIGITDAGEVAYRALTVYCTQNTDYPAARPAWVSAAQDLNPSWVANVEAAWAAVGVGTAPTNRVATPVLGPPGGAYESSINVTMTCASAGAAIHYTLDGVEPTEASLTYTAAVHVAADRTVKAKAYKAGMEPSYTASAAYTFLGTKIYDFPMNSSPGWTLTGQWAFGQPTGGGGAHGSPDPTGGYTGSNVYGYNLSGDYADNVVTTRWLTTTALNLSAASDVRLLFRRWLGVERPAYDHAYLEVSNNGSTWTRIWQNTAEVDDGAWTLQTYDISSVADRQAAVYIRWGLGPTDSSWTYCGWNLDDVQIWGNAATSQIPAAPSALSAGALSSTSVGLTWKDNANNEQGFYVSRKLLGGSWSDIATVGANTEFYADATATPGTTYVYRVRAYNSSGNSDYSNEAHATTPGAGAGDDWDPGDDTPGGATALNPPAPTQQAHGPHTLSPTDTNDWFAVYLSNGVSYNFNSVGGNGDTYAHLYEDAGGTVEVASDDDAGGGLQFSISYTPSGAGWHYLKVRTFRVGTNATYNLNYRRVDSSGDAWDPGDDDGNSTTELVPLVGVEQTHGPHTLSATDLYDCYWMYLTNGALYNFNSIGGSGDTFAVILGWDSGLGDYVVCAWDDDSGGNFQFDLNYTADKGTGLYFLYVCAYDLGDAAAYNLKYRRRNRVALDFDGDGKSDMALQRRHNGKIWFRSSMNDTVYATYIGQSTWIPAVSDYDGDGLADFSWFVPSTAAYRVYESSNGDIERLPRQFFGLAGDTPVPADYDGDGKADIALFYYDTGWIVFVSSVDGGAYTCYGGGSGPIGQPSWLPAVADYDGDTYADFSWFIPATKVWRVYPSSSNYIEQLPRVTIGGSSDIPIPADYDGDGKADMAVFRKISGKIRYKSSVNGIVYASAAGQPSWLPTPADYDGDGKADFSWFIPATRMWRVYRSGSGYTEAPRVQMGAAADWPLATPLLGW